MSILSLNRDMNMRVTYAAREFLKRSKLVAQLREREGQTPRRSEGTSRHD